MSSTYKTKQVRQIYDGQSQEQSLFNVNIKKSTKLKPTMQYSFKRIVSKHNRWNNLLNKLYLHFIKQYFDLFETDNRRWRMEKVYRLMSQFIKIKNYAECRIHHTCMIKRYKTTEGVIKGLQRRIRGIQEMTDKMGEYEGLKVSIEVELQPNPQEDEHFWSILDAKYEETYSQYS